MPGQARPIVFVSDFAFGNEWVGICHAVMLGISPASPIVDLTHLIRPFDVAGAALLVSDSMRYLSEDAVILAVVDPTVGKDREVAIATVSGRLLVGPDNGVLSLAWGAAGGIAKAVELASPDVIRPPVAESFRAPDTLCRAAAHLAAGTSIAEIGPDVDATTLAVITVAEPTIEDGTISCEVIDFNRFGNLQLNVRESHLEAAGLHEADVVTLEATAGSAEARRGSTYADFAPGDYGVIFDERGWLTIVRGNPESALEGLGLALGDVVWISRPRAGG